jgi:hypothetical protein
MAGDDRGSKRPARCRGLCALALSTFLVPACTRDDGATVRRFDDNGGGSGSATASGTKSGTGPGSGTGTSAREATPRDSPAEGADRVRVLARDFHFELDPARGAGRSFHFTVINDGNEQHEFEVVAPSGAAVGEIAPFASGARRELALDLERGTYRIQCLVERGSTTHAQLGMRTTFEVE